MEPILPFLLALALIILLAKAAGYLSVRFRQPAVLGELLMGLLLGPTVLNLFAREPFAHAHAEASVLLMAELGVIFLMFVAGLETDLQDMLSVGRAAFYAGSLGVLFPLVMGAAVALTFHNDLTHALLIGLILTATSVSISAQTLLELGLLRSREGLALLAAAVVDDVMVILLLSGFLAVLGGQGEGTILHFVLVGVRVVLYLGAAVVIGQLFFGRLLAKVSALPISEGVIALVIVVTLLYAWAAEAIGGMAAITGSFIAGLFFARTPLKKRIEEGMHTISYGLLVPVFFVSIGLRTDVHVINRGVIPFTLAIIAVAIVAKIIGCGLGARLGGFATAEALRVGIGMVSRGEVGLIVAAVELNSGLIGDIVFATTILMVLVTTLVTPVMLRYAFREPIPE